jgi:hypothetical protein
MREDQDRPGQDVQVEGLDLHLGVVDQVLDRLDVVARPEAPLQVRRLLDHADRLLVGAIGDRLRRPDEQRLGARPLVHQHHGQHQPAP